MGLSNDNKLRLMYFTLIFGVFVFFFLLYSIIIMFGDPIQNLHNGVYVQNYVKSNNLTMPFPTNNYLYTSPDKIYDLYNKPLEEYHELVINHFNYSDEYNCKYWTFVWLNWWKAHTLEYDLKIINTDNHIFLMIYNQSEYCTIDQIYVNCYLIN